jgi:hypothetical protein
MVIAHPLPLPAAEHGGGALDEATSNQFVSSSVPGSPIHRSGISCFAA